VSSITITLEVPLPPNLSPPPSAPSLLRLRAPAGAIPTRPATDRPRPPIPVVLPRVHHWSSATTPVLVLPAIATGAPCPRASSTSPLRTKHRVAYPTRAHLAYRMAMVAAPSTRPLVTPCCRLEPGIFSPQTSHVWTSPGPDQCTFCSCRHCCPLCVACAAHPLAARVVPLAPLSRSRPTAPFLS
jgi:hypothetical protein